ncbi:hypothetical protein HY627_02490 [Candidatus Uhrbacteria bacterium]|nr:hypothetical protein [Candidatus Uhrbacteria bacterium]
MDDAIFFEELDKIQKKTDDAVRVVQSEQAQAPQEFPKSALPTELEHLLERIVRDAQSALALLKGSPRPLVSTHVFHSLSSVLPSLSENAAPVGTVIEGTFDGSGMQGMDGKRYTMAPNYASKSKLVEGDAMKLTMTPEGSFIYKQLRPVERRRVMGLLAFDSASRQYSVSAEGQSWKVLTASVTYYKGIPGDEIVVLIPKEGASAWGAVEHIIKKYQ